MFNGVYFSAHFVHHYGIEYLSLLLVGISGSVMALNLTMRTSEARSLAY